MVTKPKRPGPETGTARKPRTVRAVKADPSDKSVGPGRQAVAKPNLLQAGLKALGTVRDDVVQHQSRVFEAILGVDPAQAWAGLVKHDAVAAKAAQEAFGLRKFEAVFDLRVLNALERMGMPSPEQIRSLREEVAALKSELHALKAARRSR